MASPNEPCMRKEAVFAEVIEHVADTPTLRSVPLGGDTVHGRPTTAPEIVAVLMVEERPSGRVMPVTDAVPQSSVVRHGPHVAPLYRRVHPCVVSLNMSPAEVPAGGVEALGMLATVGVAQAAGLQDAPFHVLRHFPVVLK